VIAIIAAKFITPGSFPGETGRAVEMHVLTSIWVLPVGATKRLAAGALEASS